jgi:hypothetical protein
MDFLQHNKMKKILFILLLLPYVIAAQGVKIKDLPEITTGSGSDWLIKDNIAGIPGSTRKISVNNFKTTYFPTLPTHTLSATSPITFSLGVIGLNTSSVTFTAINTTSLTIGGTTYTAIPTGGSSTTLTAGSNISLTSGTNTYTVATSSTPTFTSVGTNTITATTYNGIPYQFYMACTDEITAITATDTNSITIYAPFNFTVTSVFGMLRDAQSSGSTFTFDIKKNNTTIYSTRPTIDNTEFTTLTAATAGVLSTTTFVAGDRIVIYRYQVGTGGKGFKVAINYTR